MADKIKILFLAANPEHTTQLRLDEEIREIHEKIRAAEFRDSFELLSRWAVRPGDLLQAFNEIRPHIVHFSGHGTKQAELVLEDGDGGPKRVTEVALTALFRTVKDNITLVLLNACHSESQASAISKEIECTVGMNAAIGDEAAIIFASTFYGALAFGRSVAEAFEQGRTALMLQGIPEETTPMLLVRLSSLGITLDGDATVFDLTGEIHRVIEDHRRKFKGSVTVGELAQQAAGDAISHLAKDNAITLFGSGREELQQAIKKLSTKAGFCDLGQRFFGTFTARFLDFYASKIVPKQAGQPGFQTAGDFGDFKQALFDHCHQSAKIVHDFCGQWYSRPASIDNAHEPIISTEQFERAQHQLRALAKRRSNNKRPKGRRYLLTGLIRCKCSGSMVGAVAHNGKGGAYRYYVCTRQIRERGKHTCDGPRFPADALEHAVFERIAELGSKSVVRDQVARRALECLDTERERILEEKAVIQRQATTVRRDIGRLLDVLKDLGQKGLASVKDELERLEQEEQRLQKALNDLENTQAPIDRTTEQARKFVETWQSVGELFQQATPEERYLILQHFVEIIELRPSPEDEKAGTYALRLFSEIRQSFDGDNRDEPPRGKLVPASPNPPETANGVATRGGNDPALLTENGQVRMADQKAPREERSS